MGLKDGGLMTENITKSADSVPLLRICDCCFFLGANMIDNAIGLNMSWLLGSHANN